MTAAIPGRRNELVDCAKALLSLGFISEARLSAGGVHVSRGRLAANDGVEIGAAQLVAIIIESEPFDLVWRAPADDRLRHDLLLPCSAQIAAPSKPLYLRWSAEPTILSVAFERALVEKLWSELGAERAAVRTRIAVRDPEIDALASKFRLELRLGGPSGPRYLESLGVILAVHLLQNYAGDQPRRAVQGGLGLRRLWNVIDFVETHPGEAIGLAELADIVGLTPHHFAGAFRASTGVSPHRYIMERRILRSFELLAEPDTTITAVAHFLGFSSHGHFTDAFRRFVGVTPSQFKAGRR